MSVIYYASSNLPVSKSVFGDSPATTFAVWTPASGKSIVLTDIIFSGAAAGTVRFFLSTDLTVASNTTNIFEFMQGGSSVVDINLDAPMFGSVNQAISVQTGFNGRFAVTLNGFEQD